jgi:hypothetical protein
MDPPLIPLDFLPAGAQQRRSQASDNGKHTLIPFSQDFRVSGVAIISFSRMNNNLLLYMFH